MEPERVGRRGKPARGMFFGGLLSGILASLLVFVILACKYGPRGESITVDLYSGHTITYRHFLWKRSQISGPEYPHVRWAREHQNPTRSWYLPACSMSRSLWFEGMLAADFSTREYVYRIYSLQLAEEEKIKLLHQYHEELDALKVKQQEYYESRKFMERFYRDWNQRLEELVQDGQPAAPPA